MCHCFAEFLANSKINVKAQIKKFAENSSSLAVDTINNYLIVVGNFLNWASDEDQNHIPAKNYIKKYKRPRVVKVKPPYEKEEFNMLAAYFEKKDPEMYLFLHFLWHTGCRCGETVNIKLKDIDLKKNRILMANKIFKNEQEFVLLTETAVNIIKQVIELKGLKDNDKLFRWQSPLTPNTFIRRAEEALGIKTAGRGLHGTRRSFADRLFENYNMDVPDVQNIMRHRDISTTLNHYKSVKQRQLIQKMNEKMNDAPSIFAPLKWHCSFIVALIFVISL